MYSDSTTKPKGYALYMSQRQSLVHGTVPVIWMGKLELLAEGHDLLYWEDGWLWERTTLWIEKHSVQQFGRFLATWLPRNRGLMTSYTLSAGCLKLMVKVITAAHTSKWLVRDLKLYIKGVEWVICLTDRESVRVKIRFGAIRIGWLLRKENLRSLWLHLSTTFVQMDKSS